MRKYIWNLSYKEGDIPGLRGAVYLASEVDEYIGKLENALKSHGWTFDVRDHVFEEGKVPAQEKVTCPQILAAENEGMP